MMRRNPDRFTFCLQSIIKLNMCHLVFWQIQQENGAYKCLMI